MFLPIDNCINLIKQNPVGISVYNEQHYHAIHIEIMENCLLFVYMRTSETDSRINESLIWAIKKDKEYNIAIVFKRFSVF